MIVTMSKRFWELSHEADELSLHLNQSSFFDVRPSETVVPVESVIEIPEEPPEESKLQEQESVIQLSSRSTEDGTKEETEDNVLNRRKRRVMNRR